MRMPPGKRVQMLNRLAEGSSMRSMSRVAGVSINTVTKLLVRAGEASGTGKSSLLLLIPLKQPQHKFNAGHAVTPAGPPSASVQVPWPFSWSAAPGHVSWAPPSHGTDTRNRGSLSGPHGHAQLSVSLQRDVLPLSSRRDRASEQSHLRVASGLTITYRPSRMPPIDFPRIIGHIGRGLKPCCLHDLPGMDANMPGILYPEEREHDGLF